MMAEEYNFRTLEDMMDNIQVSYRYELNKAVKIGRLLEELLFTLDDENDDEVRAWDKTDAALAHVDDLIIELRKLYAS